MKMTPQFNLSKELNRGVNPARLTINAMRVYSKFILYFKQD